jgi:xanthine dehydrogenase accessory factor
MKELLNQINTWTANKKQMVLARVTQTWGSSPRPVGSCMLISEDMEMAGSVSGGCVEGAVLKETKSVMGGKEGKQLYYGVSDDDAWAVGLSCGGKIEIFIQPWLSASDTSDGKVFIELQKRLTENKSGILVTTLAGKTKNTFITPEGNEIGEEIPIEVLQKSLDSFEKRKNETLTVDGVPYFIQVLPKRSQLFIIGAAHITSDLVHLVSQFDFETIVIDPRGIFARNTAFITKPDQLFEKYPSEVLNDFELGPYAYAVILSHDPKIDDDALEILLRTKVAYIGALGSKKNHEKRINRLLEKGFTTEGISRIDAPIGLDIHAKGAKEIALSIMAALIKAKNAYL